MFLVEQSGGLMHLLIFPRGNTCLSFSIVPFMFPSITFFLQCSNISAKCLSRIFSNYSNVPNVLPFPSGENLFPEISVPVWAMCSPALLHSPRPRFTITSFLVGYILALVSWILFLGSLPHFL